MMLSDSFGLPKGAKHREAALKWLKLLGSKEGQDIFNPLKGSIAARLDSDLGKYNTYLQAAAKDWKSNKIVGSLAHGAVAPELLLEAHEQRTSRRVAHARSSSISVTCP